MIIILFCVKSRMVIMKEKIRGEILELEKQGKKWSEEYMKKVSELGNIVLDEKGLFQKRNG